MSFRVWILAAACALAACESAPPSASELRAAPPERIFAPTVSAPSPARVAFIRDAGGSHVRKWRISVDGAPVAVLDKAEYAVVAVDPGLRQFKVELDMDSSPRELTVRLDVHLPPGGTQVYRLGNTSESRIEIFRDTAAAIPSAR